MPSANSAKGRARGGDGARVARTSTRTPCALISSAISTERSLDERWRMASRWSNLQMPSLESASFHDTRTTSCSRSTASPHVLGGSVNSDS